ncbi:hypothetical protein ACGFSB_01850 [Streptomyces sp. NPDC048441]|uniref:hypothetical protein n=1 Tax=Streptomyces sp. NPDC048441 TaxID=3365552 RepID=UPI003723D437
MAMASKHCPKCGGNPQDFRQVNQEEEDHLATDMTRAEAQGHWRCPTSGCRWVQPFWYQSKGRLLPPSFG